MEEALSAADLLKVLRVVWKNAPASTYAVFTHADEDIDGEYPSNSSCLKAICLSFDDAKNAARSALWKLICEDFKIDAADSEALECVVVTEKDSVGEEDLPSDNWAYCQGGSRRFGGSYGLTGCINVFSCNGSSLYAFTADVSGIPDVYWDDRKSCDETFSASIWKMPIVRPTGKPAISKLQLAALLGAPRS